MEKRHKRGEATLATFVRMPKLGLTMETGRISQWFRQEGERVEKGEPLFEVVTEKITIQVESPATGILGKIVVGVDEEVPVGTVLATIVGEDEELPSGPEHGLEEPGSKVCRTAADAQEHTGPQIGQETTLVTQVKASPIAKRLARERGIELGSIVGTGPGGRITERDVLQADRERSKLAYVRSSTKLTPSNILPLSQMRRTIAERMSESKRQIPHVYLTSRVDMTRAVELRRRVSAQCDQAGDVKLTINDVIIKAVACALREVPLLNSTFSYDGIKVYEDINVGMAVATDRGLIVPVVRNADKKTLQEIAAATRELAAKARAGALTLEDVSDGTFTVSNLGMYGVEEFAAIINPPQSAILAVGTITPTPVVVNGEIAIRSMMSMTLSVDHRAIDGVLGAQFLGVVKRLLESLECVR